MEKDEIKKELSRLIRVGDHGGLADMLLRVIEGTAKAVASGETVDIGEAVSEAIDAADIDAKVSAAIDAADIDNKVSAAVDVAFEAAVG